MDGDGEPRQPRLPRQMEYQGEAGTWMPDASALLAEQVGRAFFSRSRPLPRQEQQHQDEEKTLACANVNKPLPPVPRFTPGVIPRLAAGLRPPLAAKSNNIKITSRSGKEAGSAYQKVASSTAAAAAISDKMLFKAPDPTVAALSHNLAARNITGPIQDGARSTTSTAPATTNASVEQLTQKLEALMAGYEQEMERSTDRSAQEDNDRGGRTPRNHRPRGRRVLDRVRNAITDRLGGGNGSSPGRGHKSVDETRTGRAGLPLNNSLEGRADDEPEARALGSTQKRISTKPSALFAVRRRADSQPVKSAASTTTTTTAASHGGPHLIPRKPIASRKKGEEDVAMEDGTTETARLLDDDPFADILDMYRTSSSSQQQPQQQHQRQVAEFGFRPVTLDLSLKLNPSSTRPTHAKTTGQTTPSTTTTRHDRRRTFINRTVRHSPSSSADVSLNAASAPSTRTSGVASRLDLLSTSPVGHTTRRLHLEPRFEANGLRRLTSVRSTATTSLLGSFDFERDPAAREPAPWSSKEGGGDWQAGAAASSGVDLPHPPGSNLASASLALKRKQDHDEDEHEHELGVVDDPMGTGDGGDMMQLERATPGARDSLPPRKRSKTEPHAQTPRTGTSTDGGRHRSERSFLLKKVGFPFSARTTPTRATGMAMATATGTTTTRAPTPSTLRGWSSAAVARARMNVFDVFDSVTERRGGRRPRV